MNLGLLILRVVVGSLFVGHGTQKLFGWFGGYGPEGTGGFFESLGYRRGRTMAVVGGATEAAAGAMLILGLLTPLAAAMIVGVMINAALAVHADKGVWNSDGGYELPLVFAAAAACLAFVGPGTVSIDAVIGPFNGVLYGAGAVALGVIVGIAVHSTRREDEVFEEQERVERQPRRAA